MDAAQALDDDLDTEFALDEDAEQEDGDEYVPDPRALWGSEAARAMLVVLTRRLGPDFAREVSDEITSRTLGYQAGCPDDRSDGNSLEFLLKDAFWDRLFEMPAPGK